MNSGDRQRKETPQGKPRVDSLDTQDPVDEASDDSFPASDPPAHMGTRASPNQRKPSQDES